MWHLEFVLPNLVLPPYRPPQEDEVLIGDSQAPLTLGSDFIAIAPASDPRVREIVTGSSAAQKLVASFRSAAGKAYQPAVLLTRGDAPRRVLATYEPLVAFRNAIAMVYVLRGRASGDGGVGLSPSWSDTFDFHPTIVGRNDRLATISDAHNVFFSQDAPYLATASPYISPTGQALYPDHFLKHALSAEWNKRFVRPGRDDAFSRVLFRSLEMAYQASAVPAKNQGALTDYGTQAALWVSACEVLSWPRHSRASLATVIEQLGEFDWVDRALSARLFSLKIKGRKTRVNAVQRAYGYLYDARNRFLHGEPVQGKTLRIRGDRAPLLRLAATVYRTLLAVYLARYGASVSDKSCWRQLGFEMTERRDYGKALRAAFGLKQRKH